MGAGAAACAVCCATPLLALFGIGLAGTAATVATLGGPLIGRTAGFVVGYVPDAMWAART